MGSGSEDPDRTPVAIVVVSVGQKQATIDRDPVLAVDLLVLHPDTPAEPLATSLRVPEDLARHFVEGIKLQAEVSRSDPAVLDIDWAGLGRLMSHPEPVIPSDPATHNE